MSKKVDENVVEMRFDNKNFEKNVQTSLSTLDKLKQKLNLTGASKGFEDVNKAAKKVDFSHMENSLAALEKRFSVTGIMGMTFIQNMTNGLINLAKRASDFSIGGIVEGGKSRATKIENARFQIKGLLGDAADAKEQLEAIMKDVDYGVKDTAYGLDAAASVAAQLAASGMKAGEGMQHALRGISGVAAMTNSSYEDIGRIYTTIAGNGRLMGDQLLQLSTRGMNAAATLGKYLNKSESEIRQMVSKGQIDFETFSKAMDDAFGAHAKEANVTFNGVLMNIRAALSRIGADFFGPIIAENSPLIKFLNSIRERINEIRKTLSPITKEITDKINNFFTSIDGWFKNNNILGFNPLKGFTSKIQEIKDVMNGVSAPLKAAAETFNKASDAVKDYETLVDEIIMGKWKNQPVRQQLLEEAGYNFYHAQNMVNERLGNSFRYADDYAETMDKTTDSTNNTAESTADLAERIADLSDEQMRNMGFTEEQISAFNELRKMSKKTGIPIKELIELLSADEKGNDTSVFSTRYLLFRSLKNIGETLVTVLGAVGKAFAQVFIEGSEEGLFDLVAAFHRLTQVIRDHVVAHAEQLTNTFKGLFSIIHIIATFIGAGFKIALNILSGILGVFNISLLDFTSLIGEAIYKFDRWLTVNNGVFEVFKSIGEAIGIIVKAIGQWIQQNVHLKSGLDGIKGVFSGIGDSIKNWVQGLKETDNIPKYIFEGLVNGIKSFGGMVFSALKGFVTSMIDLVKGLLGIHSPSVVFMTIGAMIMSGLWIGLKDGSSPIIDFFKTLWNKVIELVKSFDLGSVIAVALGAISLRVLTKALNVFDTIANAIENFSQLFKDIGTSLKNLTKAFKLQGVAAIIKSIGIALLALAASLFIISKIDSNRLWVSVGALGAIALILGALTIALIAISKVSKDSSVFDLGKTVGVVIAITVAVFMMVSAIKKLGDMDEKQFNNGILRLIAILGSIAVFIGALALITTKGVGLKDSIDGITKMLLKLSFSLLIMVAVFKLAGLLKTSDLLKGIAAMTAFGVFVAAMAAVAKIPGAAESVKKVGGLALSVASAIGIMVIAMKVAGTLKSKDFKNGIKVMGMLGAFVAAMILVVKISKSDPKALAELHKLGLMMIEMSAALFLLAVAVKTMGILKPSDIVKGAVVMTMFGVLVSAIVAVANITNKAGNGFSGYNISKIGFMMLALSASLLLLSASIAIFGNMETSKLIKGAAAVTILGYALTDMISLIEIANIGGNKISRSTVASIMAMAVAISAIGGIVIGFANQDQNRLLVAAGVMVSLITALGLVIFAFGKLNTPKNDSIKKVLTLVGELTLLAVPMAAFAFILYKMGNVDNPISKATALSELLVAAGLIVAGLQELSKHILKTNTKLFKNFQKIFTLIAEMMVVGAPMYVFAQVLGSMPDINNPISKATALSELLVAAGLVVAGFQALGKFVGRENMVSSSIFTLINGLFMAGLGLIAGQFADVLNKMSGTKNSKKNAEALVVLIGSMALIVGAFVSLGASLGTSGIGWLGILGELVSGVIGVGLIWAMSYITGQFADILNKMSNTNNAVKNAEALVLLIGALTLIMGALMGLGTVAVATIIGAIGFEAALLGLGQILKKLEDVIGLLDKIGNIQNAASKMTVLSKLITVITKMCSTLAAVGPRLLVADGAISALIPILTGFGALATAVGALTDKYPAIEDFIDIGIGLFKGLAEGLGEIVGSFAVGLSSTLPQIGSNLTEFIDNAKGFVDGIKQFDNKAQDGAKALVDTIGSLIWSNVFNTIIEEGLDFGSFASLGKDLTRFAKNSKGFMDAMKEMGSNNGAIEAAEALVTCVGKLTAANALDNFANFATLGFGHSIGEFASEFGDVGKGVADFKKKIGTFNGADVETVNAVAKAIEALTGAAKVVNELNDGALGNAIAKWALKDNYKVEDLKSFGEKLGDAGVGLKSFMDAINNKFSAEDLQTVETAASAISALGNAAQSLKKIKSSYSFVQDLLSDEDWKKTAEEVKKHPIINGGLGYIVTSLGGKALKNSSTGKAKFGKIEEETIPIDEFITKMEPVIGKLRGFLDQLGTIDDSQIEKIKTVMKALEYVRDLAIAANGAAIDATIDNANGGNGLDLGDKLNKFGDALKKLPSTLKEFSDLMGGTTKEFKTLGGETSTLEIEGLNIEKFQEFLGVFKIITDAVNGIQEADTTKLDTIVDAMSKMGTDEIKNFIKDFSNKDFDTSQFSTNIGNISSGLNSLLSSFDNIDEDKKAKLESVKGMLDTLSQLTSTDEGGGMAKITGNAATSNLKTYADNMKNFADNLDTFVNKLIEVTKDNKLQNAITNFNSLSSLGEGITEEQISKISSLSSTMQTAATQMITGFVEKLKSDDHKELLTGAASAWATTLKDALSAAEQIGTVGEGAKSMLTGALDPLSSDADISAKAVSIGEYVGQGFINGMGNKSSDVYQAAVSLAGKAMSGLKDGTKESSPSKIAFGIGKFVDIGLMNGIKVLAKDVYSSGYDIGDQAMMGLTKSVAKISAVIENDVDTSPRIKPIMDLSNVEEGVGTLNSMFDTNTGVLKAPNIGVFNNLSAISDGMNSRRQNGGEVVDAIDRLGKNLDNANGDVYNINGVRIDSDEQVADAVQTLVRAVNVGRRS